MFKYKTGEYWGTHHNQSHLRNPDSHIYHHRWLTKAHTVLQCDMVTDQEGK
jgi:hypothetical protein